MVIAFSLERYKINKRACLALFVVALILLVGCKPNSPAVLSAIEKMEEQPTLLVKDLSTLVSDSGKIKYKLVTPELLEFDSKSEPYMEFKQGLQITSYDLQMQVNAEIKGNYAKRFTKKDLWVLRNDVQARNLEGSLINTEELYWDRISKRIYSDKFIKITSKSEVITGIGFESNEDFTKYKILKVNGIIDISE